jgi:hypothetical protein
LSSLDDDEEEEESELKLGGFVVVARCVIQALAALFLWMSRAALETLLLFQDFSMQPLPVRHSIPDGFANDLITMSSERIVTVVFPCTQQIIYVMIQSESLLDPTVCFDQLSQSLDNVWS